MYRRDYMTVKEFKGLSRVQQIQYLEAQKTLQANQEMYFSQKQLSKYYSQCLNALPSKLSHTGKNVNRRVSSVANAICMDYSQEYAEYDTSKSIPCEAFEERDAILNQQSNRCVYCNENTANSIDHIVPSQNKGVCGMNNSLNKANCCEMCNNHLKKNKSLTEWMDICHKRWPNHWSKQKCMLLEDHVNKTWVHYYYSSDEFTLRLNKWKKFLTLFHEECINKAWKNHIDPPENEHEMMNSIEEMMVLFK